MKMEIKILGTGCNKCESAVTPIINDSAVPIPTPFKTKASAIGSVPKISAYIGIPTMVASFFGMNVAIPWANNPYGFIFTMLIALGLSATVAFVFWKRKYF